MYSRCIIKIVLISLWNFSSTLSLSPIWINWILLSLDNSFGEYTMLWLVLKDVICVTVQSYTLMNIILRIFGIVNHRDNRFESKSFVSSSNETFLHESISTNAMKWISLLLSIFENSQSRANMNGHMIKEKMEIRKKKRKKWKARPFHDKFRGGPVRNAHACRDGSRVFFSSCYAASGNTYLMPVFQIPFYSSFVARSEQQPVLVCPTKFTAEPRAPCRLYFNTPGERLSGRAPSRCAKNLKYS